MNALEFGFFNELQKLAAASKVTDGDIMLMSGLGPRARAATFPLRMFNSLFSGALAGGLLGVPIELATTGETGVPAITAALGALGTGGLTVADEYKAQKRFQELAKHKIGNL